MAGELPIRRRDWLTTVGTTFAFLCAAPAQAAAKLAGKQTRYDCVSSGVVKGSQITSTLADGRLDIQFEYNDRGRGPKQRTVIVLDDGGLPTSLNVTGYDYYKATIDERFAVRAGVATWKNAGEHESQPNKPERFYVSINGTSEESAILVRAALKNHDGRLPLWPSGEAIVEKIRTVSVANGSTKRNVTLYEISGLGYTPSPVWLDDDGSLFMQGSGWFAVVPSNWKSALPTLFDVQDKRVTERGRGIATTLPQRSATGIAITNVSLFDSERGSVRPNTTVVMNGNKIVAIGGDDVAIPSDARRIDGSGKMLLPGLWNMHFHLADSSVGPQVLAEGTTTIRDPGNSPTYIAEAKRQFESGELVGPRVIIAGLMDGTGKYTAPIGTTTDNATQAISQVHDWKKLGAVQIKMYSSLDPKLVPVIAREAHDLGMRVSGHIPAGMLAQDAARQGFDEIQHINFLFLNFMPDTMDKTQTPVRLFAAAERSGTIDLKSDAVKTFLALLKERDIVCDPTVGIFVADCLARNGDAASSGFGEIADWLPVQARRGLLFGTLPLGPGMDEKYRASAKAFSEMLVLLHLNGIRIVAGTDDLLPGFDLVRELELYSQAGIPNADVLQTATIQPARVMRMDDTLGSLTPGKLADAILVHGDPTADMSHLRRVGTVIKDGVMYDSRALYATAGVTAPPLA